MLWEMPEYQRDVVASYLLQPNVSALLANHGVNASGRAFPDLAAQAEEYCLYPWEGVGGTSAATPTVAGIIALLNDIRFQNGKSSLGFLNPMLYSAAADANVIHDVTVGITCKNSHIMPCDLGGWPAMQGWDAATGLGTPNYRALAEYVSSLP